MRNSKVMRPAVARAVPLGTMVHRNGGAARVQCCLRIPGLFCPMQVTLTPHGEELLKDQLARNAGSSPEEIFERALETLAGQQPAERKKTPAEAVADILELRKGVTLGGSEDQGPDPRGAQVLMAFVIDASVTLP